MKTNTFKKAGTLTLGTLCYAIGIGLLSIDTTHASSTTTFITLITGLTGLVLGMYYLVEYAKLAFIIESDEIDLLNDDEVLHIMMEIESMEQLYFNHDPKMRLLYEELGEKVMEKYNKQYEEINHVGV